MYASRLCRVSLIVSGLSHIAISASPEEYVFSIPSSIADRPGLYSYKHKTNTNLRVIALRTFVGSCATLMSSAVNITVLLVLDGEPGWVCMMCCNSDSRSP